METPGFRRSDPVFGRTWRQARALPDPVFALLPVCLLAVLVLFGRPVDASPGLRAEADHHIVFMVDQSGSMCKVLVDGKWVKRPAGEFEAEMARVRDQARLVLNSFIAHPEVKESTDVSFYRFGNRGQVRPFVVDGQPMAGLAVTDALQWLDGTFDDDCATYGDQHTFIAHSAYLMMSELVNEGRPLPLDQGLPDGRGVFYILAFTDEMEDHKDSRFDNRPYEEWLKRLGNSRQMKWWTWLMYKPDNKIPLSLFPFPTADAPDHVCYEVQLGRPPVSANVNPVRLPADGRFSLDVASTIRLIPGMLGGCEPEPGDVAAMRSFCGASGSAGLPTASAATDMQVQAVIDWPEGVEHTGHWALSAEGRDVADRTPDGRAVPYIPRRTLQLEIRRDRVGQAPALALPTRVLADGTYPVRLDSDQLCRELRRVYPNSSFRFPESNGAPFLQVGKVEVRRVDESSGLSFGLETLDGTAPDAPMAALTCDRMHRYSRNVRTFRTTGPAGSDAMVDWSLVVLKGDEPLTSAGDFAQLEPEEGTPSAAVTVPVGTAVRLVTPARERPWWENLIGLGFRRAPGTYEIGLCVNPRPTPAQDRIPKYATSCAGCTATETVEDGPICLKLAQPVEARPFSWLQIVVGALLLFLATWFIVRWVTRPQFPRGITIGIPRGGMDLRTAHGKGLVGCKALFWRRPLFVELLGNGQVGYWRDARLGGAGQNVKKAKGKPTQAVDAPAVSAGRVLLGVRPSPTGRSAMLLWVEAVPRNPQGVATAQVLIDGKAIPVHSVSGRRGGGTYQVAYERIPLDVPKITVSSQNQGLPQAISSEYPIRIRKGS